MSRRRCDTNRAGIWCGRQAVAKVGLACPPHQPARWHHYCQGCAHDYVEAVEQIDDEDIEAIVIDL